MKCPHCFRLEAERENRARSLASAISVMNAAAAGSDDGGEHLRLRAAALQATTELSVLNVRIAHHRDQHGARRAVRSH